MRKETTLRKEGLSIKIRRTEKGTYVWAIEADSPKLDPHEVERVVSYADAILRKKFLGEEVEVPGPPEPQKKVEKTIPLESKSGKLFGRIIVYADGIVLEPLKPLPVRDGAIGWLLGYLEGKYGKEKVGLDHDRTDLYFRKIILAERPGEDDLGELRSRAAWAFIRASIRRRGWRR